MKPQAFRYLRPQNLEEALAALSDAEVDIRPIAGGQSLVPMMSLRLAAPSTLLDLGCIASLRGIRVDESGSMVAGSMTTHSDFEHSDIVARLFPLLPVAMESVAHIPIRSRGSIGGSLAHADPAGDWPALSVACGAKLVLNKQGGVRTVMADEFFCGIFSTVLEPDELLTEIHFPFWPSNRRWGLQKFARRRGDFALAGAIVLLDVEDDGRVSWARIVVNGATEMPTVLSELAAGLEGNVPDASMVEALLDQVESTVEVRSDLHASAAYRKELVRVMIRRALQQALPTLEKEHD